MIHYHNGKPVKNIRLLKAKRHAVDHYRHTERIKAWRETINSLLICLVAFGLLAIVYLTTN